MEYYKNELCVTYEELTSGDDPVAKYETLKSNITRGNIRTARSGKGEGSYALIVYSSLPDKYKSRFVAKYGNPEELLTLQDRMDRVKTDDRAREFYETYRYEMNGIETGLSEKLRAEYTLNASVLNESKCLERDIDKEIQRVNNALGNRQPSLFGA